MPGYEARLLDDEGGAVAQGDVGTLWLKGDSAALYYHADYAKSTEHLRGGWIVSGDKFRQDADGYWYYRRPRRRSDQERRHLCEPDRSRECAWSSTKPSANAASRRRKDAAGLEKPVAIVFLRDGFEARDALAAELIAFAGAAGPLQGAARVIFATVALPRNDRDKIDRKAMKAWLA